MWAMLRSASPTLEFIWTIAMRVSCIRHLPERVWRRLRAAGPGAAGVYHRPSCAQRL